jgi:hypothetical protein
MANHNEFEAKFSSDKQRIGLEGLQARNEVKRRTVCNVLRRIHLLSQTSEYSNEIEHLLAEAVYMAKRMSKKLQQNADERGEGFYDANAWEKLPEGFLDKI